MLNQRPAPKRHAPKKNRPFKNRRPGQKPTPDKAADRPGQRERRDERKDRPVQPQAPRQDYSQYVKAPPRTYQVVFFETVSAARAESARIQALAATCDQLNVVVRAEADMDDRELLAIDPKVKVFAGAAWTLIHERRVEEGWYEKPQS